MGGVNASNRLDGRLTVPATTDPISLDSVCHDLELGNPLRVFHPIRSGQDQSKWKPVLVGQRRTVHGVRQHDTRGGNELERELS